MQNSCLDCPRLYYTGFHELKWCSDQHNSFATMNDSNWGNCPLALPIIASDFTYATKSRLHELAS